MDNLKNTELTEDLFIFLSILVQDIKPADEYRLRDSWQDNWWKVSSHQRKIILVEFLKEFEKDIHLSNQTVGFSNN